MEEWKVIKGYENYSISNHGRIMNNKTNKILKPYKNKGGYLRVMFNKKTNMKQKFIHHLVWDAFVGTDRKGLIIDHISNDRLDNRLDNLRLGTYQDNSNWYWKEQRYYE